MGSEGGNNKAHKETDKGGSATRVRVEKKQANFTCENKVDKEADKEGKEGEGGETPGEGNSPGGRQGEREAASFIIKY